MPTNSYTPQNYVRFNPRPREGATSESGEGTLPIVSFNPRPREGATPTLKCLRISAMVSIHAPVKGRPTTCQEGPRARGFNPRPREGATHSSTFSSPISDCFNPRPREGATLLRMVAITCMGVSIHAPVKGRPYSDALPRSVSSFNPRPREGATRLRAKNASACLFQSTPP